MLAAQSQMQQYENGTMHEKEQQAEVEVQLLHVSTASRVQ